MEFYELLFFCTCTIIFDREPLAELYLRTLIAQQLNEKFLLAFLHYIKKKKKIKSTSGSIKSGISNNKFQAI